MNVRMQLTAVVDSSPLINLVHLELAEMLHFYFDTIYVPRMVQREVNRKSKFRHRLNKLYSKGVFKRCLVVDAVSVLLLDDELDEGEAEALVQASEKGVAVFIGDEKDARSMSEKRGLRPVGTARLLARMHLEGYAAETGTLVQKLRRDLNCRITDQVVREAIRIAETPF
jgi:predicted nucleic acid-binding protein